MLDTTLGQISPFSLQPYSPLPSPEMLPDFAKQPLQELDFSLGSEMCSDSFSCIVGVLKMSLRELLTTQPTGVFPDALPNPNPFDDDDIDLDFTLETTIDELFPDLFVGTLGADSIFGNNGGPDKTTNVGLDIEILPDPPDFPVTIPDTPNDILIGFGDNDFLSGSDGDDILLGDALAPNDTGSDGNDTLNGDGGNDLFIGGGVNDSLNGGDGNDVLFGDYFLGFDIANIDINLNDYLPDDIKDDVRVETPNPIQFSIGSGNEGNDFISGGAGDDIAIGDKGNDTINGDEGKDFLIGSADDDIINGGDGDDIIIGDYLVPQGFSVPLPDGQFNVDLGPAGNDIMSGGAGNDVISGDDGIDTASYRQDPKGVTVTLGILSIPGVGTAQDGFGGTDLLFGIENVIGSSFNDNITGDTNNNVITAGAGEDIVSAGGGNDTVFGEEGKDFLDGGYGDDVLNGGPGGDILIGGLFGSDTASYSTSVIEVSVSLTTGTGISGDAREDWLIDIENLEGSNFGDILTGNFANNTIRGLGGDDKIYGEAGDDVLNGQLGDDFLFGGLGNDELFGEAGKDVLFGEAGNDQLFGGDDLDELDGGAGDDRIFGEVGNDKLLGQEGDDQLFGGTDNDTIDGGSGVDILWGDGGNDILLGKAGNDALDGGDGNDELYGDEGDDILEGGIGQDQLYGGTGKDLFVFAAGAGTDTIFDFQDSQDLLGLKNSLTFGQLAIVQGTGINANNTLISIQTSGELLATLIGVEANTLTAQHFVSV